MDSMTIAVFGSARPEPGSEAYIEANLVGRLLAENGFVVMTGGYSGVMAAVSQGAAEAGGHVIGVTSNRIESFRPTLPNEWIAEEIRYDTQHDRLLHLVTHNDGMIVLPGGIGTLSEMAMAWSMMQTGELLERPLVLMGGAWRDWLSVYAGEGTIRQRDLDLLYLANGPITAVGYITQRLAGQ